MTSSSVLEQIRAAVAAITETDLSGHAPEQALTLDSIARITLIAELENLFGLELAEEDTMPETFESLATLTAMIEGRLA